MGGWSLRKEANASLTHPDALVLPQAAAHARLASHRSSFAAATRVPCGVSAGVRGCARTAAVTTSQFCDDADLDAAGFGQHVFKGDVAAKYLSKYGESAALLDGHAWTATKSDAVASALLDWARDNGASVYCHWFCPMGSSGAWCCGWTQRGWAVGRRWARIGRQKPATNCP